MSKIVLKAIAFNSPEMQQIADEIVRKQTEAAANGEDEMTEEELRDELTAEQLMAEKQMATLAAANGEDEMTMAEYLDLLTDDGQQDC